MIPNVGEYYISKKRAHTPKENFIFQVEHVMITKHLVIVKPKMMVGSYYEIIQTSINGWDKYYRRLTYDEALVECI